MLRLHRAIVLLALGVSCGLCFAVNWEHNTLAAPLQLAAAPAAAASLVPVVDIQQVGAGDRHTCALTTAGGVKCWGWNGFGQLGDDTTVDHATPLDVQGLQSGVQALAVGSYHTCALTAGGGVWCWGRNYFGQLGDGTTIDRSAPVEVPDLRSGVQALAAGYAHTCAVTADDAVKCWGANSSGQLGDGTTTDRPRPEAVAGLVGGAQALTAGIYHTCALMVAGGVECWGGNADGRLGNGTNEDSLAPVTVVGLNSGVQSVTAGDRHTCALTATGGVKCWGGNGDGQLGDGTMADRSLPVAVAGLGSGVQALAAGDSHTCAVTTDGSVSCWGGNYSGQLGNATTTAHSTPAKVTDLNNGKAVLAAGYAHTCVVTTPGGLKCWGRNFFGQLGDGTNGERRKPVDVLGLSGGRLGLAVGDAHACALTAVGGVKCWGVNGRGQLGDGTKDNRQTPVNVTGLSAGVQAVAAGRSHTCALTAAGGVKCWGSNFAGQLGDGTTTDHATPVDVAGLSSGVKVLAIGDAHTCALTTGGDVKCWGRNYHGQLGDGTNVDHETPLDVPGLGSGVQLLSAGSYHTCAVTSGGAAWCWGLNDVGQLGDGSTANRLTPVAVAGLDRDVTAIAAGASHTCAVTTAGAAHCWGGNGDGRLGDGTTLNRTTPVDVVGLSGGVQGLAVGGGHTCALTNVGGVRCWGGNYEGQLGDGTAADRLTSVPVTGLDSGVQALAAGHAHTCAQTTTGSVKCWGENDDGQLGDGTAWREVPVDVQIDCHALTLSHSGTGGDPTALPARSPGCPGSLFVAGQAIHLYANPAVGWQVTGWTGTTHNAGTALTNTVSMPAANHAASVIYDKSAEPPPGADDYEVDDTCALARPISTDGTPQIHTFHRLGDQDWLVFEAQAGATYRIETRPELGSPADVSLAVYESCADAPVATQEPSFSSGNRLQIAATRTGLLLLQLGNVRTDVAGQDVDYQVNVRQLEGRDAAGALIIVAGRRTMLDPYQPNITYVANEVYRVFSMYGYSDDRIRYLSADTTQPGVDGPPTLDELRTALTSWALPRVDATHPLNLYLVDHGNTDRFYLDVPNNQVLTPAMLDSWLSAVEQAAPGVKINVFIEACKSGSFIVGADDQQIAKSGRLVMTTANATHDAYVAPQKGARFSDVFLDRLELGRNILFSFLEASEAAALENSWQVAWIDADGDGVPNEPADHAIAARRGFGNPGTLCASLQPSAVSCGGSNWSPYIVTVQGPAEIVGGRGVLTATVLDDARVQRVWVDVYPPGYTPPASVSGELVREVVPGAVLRSVGSDQFAVDYPGFDEPGTHRVVVHAEDEDGSEAQPVVLFVDAGRQLFLPAILR